MLESRSLHHFHDGSPFDLPVSNPVSPAKLSGSRNSTPLRRVNSAGLPVQESSTSARHARSPFSRSSIATARMALKALLGSFYPSPACILTAAPVIAVLIAALILFTIVRVTLSRRAPISYQAPSMTRIDHLSHECQFLSTLPYRPDNERHGE